MFVIVRVPVVAPAMAPPFFLQTNENGAVPDGVVLKTTVPPAQLVTELNGVAPVLELTLTGRSHVVLTPERVSVTITV